MTFPGPDVITVGMLLSAGGRCARSPPGFSGSARIRCARSAHVSSSITRQFISLRLEIHHDLSRLRVTGPHHARCRHLYQLRVRHLLGSCAGDRS